MRRILESWTTIISSVLILIVTIYWYEKSNSNDYFEPLIGLIAITIALVGIFLRIFPEPETEKKLQVAYHLPIHLANHYKTHSDFTQIRINGDKTALLGSLSMEDYFIQLSYVEHQKLADRESLLNEEQQPSSEKIKINSIFRAELSAEAISDNILGNNHRIVISGNPGVGKSTYAKWLCHQWALHKINIPTALIYLQLRDLDLAKQNFLAHEICQRYLQGLDFSTEDLHKLLQNYPHDYLLVLDGLDELSAEMRQKLFKELDRFYPQADFLLLSRPYGLIGLPVQPGAHFRIDGFNDANIRAYIRTILTKSDQPGKSENEVTDILAKNKVLRDYAHAPLMLSYIMLIYLTDPQARQTLQDIDSLYQLQREVFAWIINYEKDKGNPLVLDPRNSRMRELNALAYRMQLDKKFIWKGTLLDRHEILADDLSNLGFGNKKTHEPGADWQFSFHTVTFQEYLAAGFVADEISAEAVIYLLQDRFFWTFVRFIVGKISLEQKNGQSKDRLLTLFQRLKKETEKNEQHYLTFLYYLLAGECNREMVQTLITQMDIDLLIVFFEKNYFDDYWQGIILDAIGKIHAKLPPQLIQHYKSNLVKRISTTRVAKNQFLSEMEQPYYLVNLLKTADLSSDPEVIAAMIRVLEYGFPKSKKIEEALDRLDNDEALYTDEKYMKLTGQMRWIWNVAMFYINLLCEADPERLTPFAGQIRRLVALCPEDLMEYMVKLSSLVESHDFLLADAENQLKILADLAEKAPGDSEVLNDEGQLMAAAECLSKLGNKYVKTSQPKPSAIKIIARQLAAQILPLLEQSSMYKEGQTNQVAALTLQGLIALNEPDLYEILFEFANSFEHGLYISIPDNEAYLQYISGLLQRANAAGLDEFDHHVTALLAGLSQTENARFSFSRFKDGLLEVFSTLYILSLKEDLEPEKKEQFQHYLHEIAQIPYYAFDKKFLLNRVLALDYPREENLKKIILAILFDHEFSFYEPEYWTVFFELFEANTTNKFDVLHQVFNNDGLFQYQSNLPYIDRLLDDIQIHLLSSTADASPGDIIDFVSQGLFLYKKSDQRYHPPSFLQKTQTILLDKKMIRQMINGIGELPDALCAYLFQHYLHPFEGNPLKRKSYFKIITQQYEGPFGSESVEASTLTAVYEKMFRFITDMEHGLYLDDIRHFHPLIGKDLEREFTAYVQKYLFYKDDFEQSVFETYTSSLKEF
ncbi:MAG: NACHT domain-containing protein [Saprospiraceae bacterium]|nr:NACHT domain-containing protein [Saprospiraceae bacterium]